MKKVLTVLTCSILAACSCNETQWEEVDNVVFEEVEINGESMPINPGETETAKLRTF